MAFKLNQADLAFVLKQIKIGEANANGIPLTEIVIGADGNPIISQLDPAYTLVERPDGSTTYRATNPNAARAVPDDQAPYGIRTVDGSYNNLVEGREMWGAAGHGMPRLLDGGAYLNEADGDSLAFGPNTVLSNTNYTPGTMTNLGPGTVVDADPRLISNLVSDMSLNNPAAIVAALTFAGAENAYATLAEIQAASASWAADLAVLLKPGTTPADLAVKAVAQANLNTFLEDYSLEVDASGSLSIPNVAPDEGLSAPFNSWMTFFGQFFDHGLDLISKGSAGTIYIPLSQDDPLYNHATPHTNFMVLTRSTPVINAEGEQSQRNVTTSWVDQNQTYTSNASHQVFLREYERNEEGDIVTTGRLLDGLKDGSKNGLPTWADVKAQALEMLGIRLEDRDIGAVPLLRTDAYGEFVRDPVTGYAQLIVGIGADGVPNTADDIVVSGTPSSPVNPTTAGAIRTQNAFLDDIAHNAVPTGVYDHDNDPQTSMVAIAADADTDTGNAIATDSRGNRVAYDNELLDRHFITGDGRGNENIGLTTVHHVFHSEHNRQVELQKATILGSGDLGFINEWLLTDVSAIPADLGTLNWDGERLFQAARMATEMQYQHLVFEEFGRKIQPAIDPFVFNSVTDIDPSIFSEFANVVYRFGHSMLTDSMPRVFLDESGNVTSQDDMGLIASFLNPVVFNNDGTLTAEEAAGAVVRGMTTERGNEIDEFLTGALRNNLLGIPLDLGAINIARGRDTNMPTLNEAREQLYAATGSSFLKPYESWAELATNLKNPLSVVNFIAAYGTHPSLAARLAAPTTADPDATRELNVAEKRAVAMELVFGVRADGTPSQIGDRTAFLNSTGAWAPAGLDGVAGNADDRETGLNNIDLWIGGLAEKKMPFGGFLGSTFNAVFEAQMENLQDGDRFYYLTRTQGQNFLTELEQNSFAKMIMANTDISNPGPDGIRGTDDDIVTRHIGVDSFATYDYVFEVNAANQADYDPTNASASGVDPTGSDPVLEALGMGKVVRDNPATPESDTHYFRTFGGEHVVVGGTNQADTIITDFGDDGIWGDGGDDRIESGAGVDLVNGGAGDDIITDSGDTGDFLKGDSGNDVIANSNGLDILMGGTGNDVFFVGVDDTEVFAGEGDDFVLGGDGVDLLIGGEGSDWMEGGGGFDTTAGDNSELFFNSAIKGHDVMFSGSEEHDFDAESGDDIMVQGESVMRNEGMFGFDWAIFKGMALDGYADMRIPIFTTEEADTLRNRFDKTEALSGWDNDDTLIGDDRVLGDIAPGDTVATTEAIFFNDGLDQAGIDRIAGLDEIVSVGTTGFFESGNILLGGGGSDNMRGNGGDDILDGDRWLNVRISIRASTDGTGPEIATVDSMRHVFAAGQTSSEGQAIPTAWHGKSLFELMIARTITPAQMQITREILETGVGATDVDTAYYNDTFLAADGTANYTIVENDDGSFTVSHVNVTVGVVDPLTERNLVSDGVDTLRNIEVLQFADRAISLVKPTLELNGFDSTTRTWGDNFTARTYNNNNATATEDFNGPWTEAFDGAGSATAGSVQITAGGTLTFSQGNLDDASVTRTLSLAGAASATVTFSINDTGVTALLLGLGDNEEIIFEFAADGVNFVTLQTFDGNNGGNDLLFTLPTDVPFGAAAAIRFRANNTLDPSGGIFQPAESFSIDNLVISAVFQQPATPPSINVTTSFTENAATIPIASDPRIADDGQTLVSARIVLTNTFPGDTFVIPEALTGPNAAITATTQTVGSTFVVTLTGTASIAAYQAAIQSIGYRSNSENPDLTPRVIEVTVNDGFFNSNVARTTVNVTAVNDLVVANNDTILTNLAPGTPIVVPESILLANDIDPDTILDITAVSSPNGLTAALNLGSITVTDSAAPDGSFIYTTNGGSDTATVTLDTVVNTTTYNENFNNDPSYTSNDVIWTDDWVETLDDNSSTSDNGQIRITADTDRLEFDNGSDVANSNGAVIQRGLAGLAGALSATISYDVTENLEAGEQVLVQFSRDGISLQTVQTIGSTNNGADAANLVLNGPFTAGAFIRFTASAMDDANDLVSIDNISIGFTNPANSINGGGGGEILIGDVNGSAFNAAGGNDTIIGGLGNDTINGGTGDDLIVWNANASGATDGRDFINGAENTDTVRIIGNEASEAFVVYSRQAAQSDGIAIQNLNTEIVITRNGQVVTELDNIEEIIIDTGLGNDTVTTRGDFNPTSLNFSTITVNDGGGDDTVDISGMRSAHRLVFRSNGGSDKVIGPIRPQDLIEGQGVTRVETPSQETVANLDDEDLEDLLAMVRDGLVRDASGYGNNIENPNYGTAGQNFIRLTDASYTDGVSGVRGTALTPREISNIVSNQDNNGDGVEESIPNQFGGTALLTFFGQYFDHGLDFVAKGDPGNVQIGGQGFPISAPRSNIVEGTGVDPDGVPNNGDEIAAEYVNNVSPFVDQNQAYGSHEAITDILRQWVPGDGGEPQQTAYLLTGATDASGYHLLPTLTDIRENYRVMTKGQELTAADVSDYDGTGQALLIDFIPAFITLPDATEPSLDLDAIGHYFVAGDGRVNENVMLTSIHTIWARNHNFWVDKIREETSGAWTEEEYFQTARMMNIAEYQQVVFTEFTEAMAGGLVEGDDEPDVEHNFQGYDPTVDASISIEFAQAAYRFGHSMLNENLSYVNADGVTVQLSLVEAFLRPDRVADLGIEGFLAGAVADQHQAIDVDMVNALRNQLVGRPLDLAALNIFRGRDMGIAPFNEVRAQLFERTGIESLRPYSGWDDFQARNGVSDAVMAQLKQAYPEGFGTMDMWSGGLAEKPTHGQLGSTFGHIFLEQMDRLQHGDRFYYLEIFDDSIFENARTFSQIVARNTGLTDLPANVFQNGTIQPPVDEDEDDDGEQPSPDTPPVDDGDDDDNAGGGEDEGDEDEEEDEEEDDDTTGGGTDDDDGTDTVECGGDDDTTNPGTGGGTTGGTTTGGGTTTPPAESTTNLVAGTANADVLSGTAGGDTVLGLAGDDNILSGDGPDVVRAGDGNDFVDAGGGRDVVFGGAGDDDILAGSGDDMLYGDGGADRILAGAGNDLVTAGTGNDDVIGGDGADLIVAETGDGDDRYWGDEMGGGTGIDTLDLSAISANITANLGTGLAGRGSASSSQSGTDTLWGIENLVGGSGNDDITASDAVNVMDGGLGADTYRFQTAAAANGDTIASFQPGDRVDLSAIDANQGVAGNQAFTLATGAAFTGVGQLLVTEETRADGDYTVIQANTGGDATPEFRLSIKGSPAATAADFAL